MKTAILTTSANIGIARKFLANWQNHGDTSLYFKRGNVCHKQCGGQNTVIFNRFKWEILRDVLRERFDNLILVELPGSPVKLLPYFAIVALASGASHRSLLFVDGSCTPLTRKDLISCLVKFFLFLLKFAAIWPLMVANLLLVVFSSVIVDLVTFFWSMSPARRISGPLRAKNQADGFKEM